jgi:hypothetical protein
MIDSNIYNERGLLRSDLENVQVPPARRPVFDALCAAVKLEKEAEAALALADAAVAEAVKHHDQIVATVPKSTFRDEWRTMAAQSEQDRRRRNF